VLFVSLRDLQWRLRRFVIGVLATGLVFALALLISGVSGSFQQEVIRSVDSFHADRWFVAERAFGPFTSSTLIPQSDAAAVAREPGVTAADPVALLRFTVTVPKVKDVNLIGVVPNGVGAPEVSEGRGLERSGEVVADESAGVPLGGTLDLGGTQFRVVGRTKGVSYYGGTPVVFIPLPDAQRLLFGGQPLATAIVVRGAPTAAPPGLRVLTNAAVKSDLRRPLAKATQTIEFLRVLLWVIAAGIIGSVLYLQALERTRDFAVFKATGVSSRTLLVGIALQAMVLAILAAIAALVLSFLLTPTMAMNIAIPTSSYVALPIVAIVVGLVSSMFGLRRAVTVDPALAFGGA
jgi:putative ABC transport system permease protein